MLAGTPTSAESITKTKRDFNDRKYITAACGFPEMGNYFRKTNALKSMCNNPSCQVFTDIPELILLCFESGCNYLYY